VYAPMRNSGRTEFLIGAYTSDPAILDSGNPLTVMIPPNFNSYIQPFIDKVKTKEDAKLGLMATASEYGEAWTKSTIKKWEASGGEVLAKNNIDYGTVSDIEEAREQGYEGAFFIIDQAKFEELEEFTDPKNLNNSVGIMPLRLSEGTEDFIADYKEKYSSEKPVNPDIALNYQSLPIFLEAMKIAGTIDDPVAIRAAMGEAVKSAKGVLFVPNAITDKGHLQADGLQAAYRNADGEYELFDIEQPKE